MKNMYILRFSLLCLLLSPSLQAQTLRLLPIEPITAECLTCDIVKAAMTSGESQTDNHSNLNEDCCPDPDRNLTESGSYSQSSNGYLSIRDDDGNCSKQYYYIYTYQYAYIYRGEVQDEDHDFDFSGFLDEGGEPSFIGKIPGEHYLLYENSNYYLKIPYKSGDIYFSQKGSSIITSTWQRLD